MSPLSEEHQRFQSWVQEVIDADAVGLAARWLELLVDLLPEPPSRVFPSETLLDHIPSLIRRLSQMAFGEADSADHRFVELEILQLAEMRRAQGYETEELQAEFALLSEVVLTHLEGRIQHDRVHVAPAVALATWRQLNAALESMGRMTARVYRERIASDRLERARLIHTFCRALSHELRNRLNVSHLALQFVGKALERGMDPGGGMDRLRSGLRRAEGLIEDVYTLAAAHGPIEVHTGLGRELNEVVHDVTASLASMAGARDVRLEIAPDLPTVRVDAGRVQLILVCLVAHAVRESAAAGVDCAVHLSARQITGDRCEIGVEDHAAPVPESERARLFELPGLHLAQEAANQLGAVIELSPGKQGNRFTFTVTQAGDRLGVPGRSMRRDESTDS